MQLPAACPLREHTLANCTPRSQACASGDVASAALNAPRPKRMKPDEAVIARQGCSVTLHPAYAYEDSFLRLRISARSDTSRYDSTMRCATGSCRHCNHSGLNRAVDIGRP